MFLTWSKNKVFWKIIPVDPWNEQLAVIKSWLNQRWMLVPMLVIFLTDLLCMVMSTASTWIWRNHWICWDLNHTLPIRSSLWFLTIHLLINSGPLFRTKGFQHFLAMSQIHSSSMRFRNFISEYSHRLEPSLWCITRQLVLLVVPGQTVLYIHQPCTNYISRKVDKAITT